MPCATYPLNTRASPSMKPLPMTMILSGVPWTLSTKGAGAKMMVGVVLNITVTFCQQRQYILNPSAGPISLQRQI